MFHQARRPPRTAFVGASGRASRRFEPTLSRHEKHASDTGEGLRQTVGISDRRDGDLASLLGPWPIVTLGDEKGKCPLEVGVLDQFGPKASSWRTNSSNRSSRYCCADGVLVYMPPLVPLLVLGSVVPAGLFSGGSAALGL